MKRSSSTKRSSRRTLKPIYYKPVVFLLSLLPFVLLTYALIQNQLGPNPIEALEKQTGEWSLRFLVLSLAMTPIAQIFKVLWPIKLRRMIGLFAFFYVSVHLMIYVVFDQSLNFKDILSDVLERPYIAVGFIGFLILMVLAITSNRFMVRKLKHRWHLLHRSVYIASLAAVVHYIWLAKGDLIEPYVYLLILAMLLAWRVVRLLQRPTT